MNQVLSSLRSQILQLQLHLPELLQSALGREPLLQGSIYTLRRKCGKPSCRCQRGELHASTILSHRAKGRTRSLSPKPEHLNDLKTMTDRYRRCREDRAELVRWQKQLLQLVDEIENARVQLGENELQKLSLTPRKTRSPKE